MVTESLETNQIDDKTGHRRIWKDRIDNYWEKVAGRSKLWHTPQIAANLIK